MKKGVSYLPNSNQQPQDQFYSNPTSSNNRFGGQGHNIYQNETNNSVRNSKQFSNLQSQDYRSGAQNSYLNGRKQSDSYKQQHKHLQSPVNDYKMPQIPQSQSTQNNKYNQNLQSQNQFQQIQNIYKPNQSSSKSFDINSNYYNNNNKKNANHKQKQSDQRLPKLENRSSLQNLDKNSLYQSVNLGNGQINNLNRYQNNTDSTPINNYYSNNNNFSNNKFSGPMSRQGQYQLQGQTPGFSKTPSQPIFQNNSMLQQKDANFFGNNGDNYHKQVKNKKYQSYDNNMRGSNNNIYDSMLLDNKNNSNQNGGYRNNMLPQTNQGTQSRQKLQSSQQYQQDNSGIQRPGIYSSPNSYNGNMGNNNGTIQSKYGQKLPKGYNTQKTNQSDKFGGSKNMYNLNGKDPVQYQLGDLLLKFQSKTKAGCNVNKQTKTNQDVAIVCPNALTDINIGLFAVADGHGVNGHLVSGQIKKHLPKTLQKYLKDCTTDDAIISGIQRAFYVMNQEIFSSDYDSNLSGSTLISVLMTNNNKIFTANVGDSRAVMARYEGGVYKAYPMSVDLKPSLERERQRIIKLGGRVDKQKDLGGNPIGPMRVWLKNLDIPGLAMTRSFGDKIGAQAGVIAEPEIIQTQIQPSDRFMVIASDGVWEYLSDQDVIKLVAPYIEKGQLEAAAEKVVNESTLVWRRESFARDDITCVIVNLNQFNNNNQQNGGISQVTRSSNMNYINNNSQFMMGGNMSQLGQQQMNNGYQQQQNMQLM